MLFIIPKLRGTDAHGSGAYGAPRGERTHNGHDYAVKPGSMIYSPFKGIVTKLGYPYSWDLSFRYVEIERLNKDRIRYLYVFPAVGKRKLIAHGDPIGTVQRLPYEGITQHVHVEVRKMINRRRKLVDPVEYFEEYWG